MSNRSEDPSNGLFETADLLAVLARDLRAVAERRCADVDPEVTIEAWAIGCRTVPVLVGLGVGHPTFGTRMLRTSELYHLDQERGLARTLSRWYRLGSPAALVSARSGREH